MVLLALGVVEKVLGVLNEDGALSVSLVTVHGAGIDSNFGGVSGLGNHTLSMSLYHQSIQHE